MTNDSSSLTNALWMNVKSTTMSRTLRVFTKTMVILAICVITSTCTRTVVARQTCRTKNPITATGWTLSWPTKLITILTILTVTILVILTVTILVITIVMRISIVEMILFELKVGAVRDSTVQGIVHNAALKAKAVKTVKIVKTVNMSINKSTKVFRKVKIVT